MIDNPSPNHEPRPAGARVDMLVLHYTGMPSAAAALARLCDPAAKVSAHYLVEEDGRIRRLVAEQRRAWHAGISRWRGHHDINSRSIGIELVNPGHEFGYRAFPAEQMRAVRELAGVVLARHPIPPRNVVAHSDVAPLRKEDPGELFDWAYLAQAGIGLWPLPATAGDADRPLADIQAMLAEYGYDLEISGVCDDQTRAVVRAFQRHFRPHRVDGQPDPDTGRRLAALLAAIRLEDGVPPA